MLVGHLFVNSFTLDPDERLSHAARTPSCWGVMEEPNHTNLVAKLDMTSLAVHLPKMAEKWHTNRIQQKKNHSLNLVVGILCFQIVAGTRPNARNGRKLANKGAARTTVAKWCCSTRCRPVWTSSLPLVLHVFLFVSRWPKVFFDSFWNSLYSLELPCQSQHLMVTSRWVEAFWHLLTRRINANRGHGKGESAICRVFLLLRDRHCCWAESDLGNVWLNKLGTCCGHELGKSKKSKGTRYLMQYE